MDDRVPLGVWLTLMQALAGNRRNIAFTEQDEAATQAHLPPQGDFRWVVALIQRQ
jgi:hypothetical protein